MVPGQFKVDIFAELDRIGGFELCILEGSITELRDLAENPRQKGADREAARLGLQLVEAKDVQIVSDPEGTDVDDRIVSFAKDSDAVVATQDAELKRRLRELKIPIVVLRQGSHLELVDR
jgi:rRNA-processing protein FCF1